MDHTIYKYPRFQKRVYFMLFLMSILFFLVSTISSIISTVDNIANHNITIEHFTSVLAFMLIGIFLLFMAYYVNMLTPDIRLRKDSFQLKTVFYQSQWLRWKEILFIKKHHLSTKHYKWHGIGIDNIHPIYSFVGLTQKMGGKSFLLTEKIQGYEELMQVIEMNRPDLF